MNLVGKNTLILSSHQVSLAIQYWLQHDVSIDNPVASIKILTSTERFEIELEEAEYE